MRKQEIKRGCMLYVDTCARHMDIREQYWGNGPFDFYFLWVLGIELRSLDLHNMHHDPLYHLADLRKALVLKKLCVLAWGIKFCFFFFSVTLFVLVSSLINPWPTIDQHHPNHDPILWPLGISGYPPKLQCPTSFHLAVPFCFTCWVSELWMK